MEARAVRAQSSPLLLWAALATIYVVWGSTYLAIRVMVETMPPLLGAGFRFLFAGGILYAWLYVRGGRLRVQLRLRELLAALVIGALLMLGGNGLVTVAEQAAPSGLAALIIAAVPLWVIVLRFLWRERVPAATMLGVVVGFVLGCAAVAPFELDHAPGVTDHSSVVDGDASLVTEASRLCGPSNGGPSRITVPIHQ